MTEVPKPSAAGSKKEVTITPTEKAPRAASEEENSSDQPENELVMFKLEIRPAAVTEFRNCQNHTEK